MKRKRITWCAQMRQDGSARQCQNPVRDGELYCNRHKQHRQDVADAIADARAHPEFRGMSSVQRAAAIAGDAREFTVDRRRPQQENPFDVMRRAAEELRDAEAANERDALEPLRGSLRLPEPGVFWSELTCSIADCPSPVVLGKGEGNGLRWYCRRHGYPALPEVASAGPMRDTFWDAHVCTVPDCTERVTHCNSTTDGPIWYCSGHSATAQKVDGCEWTPEQGEPACASAPTSYKMGFRLLCDTHYLPTEKRYFAMLDGATDVCELCGNPQAGTAEGEDLCAFHLARAIADNL